MSVHPMHSWPNPVYERCTSYLNLRLVIDFWVVLNNVDDF